MSNYFSSLLSDNEVIKATVAGTTTTLFKFKLFGKSTRLCSCSHKTFPDSSFELENSRRVIVVDNRFLRVDVTDPL